MMATDAVPLSHRGRSWRFAGCRFDEASLSLTVADKPIALERRPLKLLAMLLANAGEIVTKDEIIEALWSGRAVSEASLTTCMTRLRQALGDVGHSAIRTVHGYGYRFAAPVMVFATDPAKAESIAELAFAPGDPVPLRPNWHLARKLGRGGFGDAWLVEQSKSQERHVVKFARNEAGLIALRREVSLGRLLREGVGPRDDFVRILDWNFSQNPYFVEIPFFPDGSLADWCEAQGGVAAVPLATRLDLVAQIADALAAAHGLGVLHKDIKPGNILMRRDAMGRPCIALTDFGSGRALDQVRLDALGITRPFVEPTEEVSTSGTALYSAPELSASTAPTPQADIFALGVLLFQLAAGDLRRPLSADWEVLIPDPLLREDIAAAAAGEPAARLTDAAELATRLRALPERRAASATAAAAAAEAVRIRQALDRDRARRAPLLALLVILLSGFAISTTLYIRSERAKASAETEAARAKAVTEFLTDDLFSAANPLLGADPNIPISRVLNIAAADLDRRFPPGNEDRAAIEAAIGSAYAGLADADHAAPLLRRALDRLRVQFGEDDPQTQAVRLAMAQLAEHMLDGPGMRAAGFAILAAHPHDPATEINGRFYAALGGCDHTDGEACAAQIRPLLAEATSRLGQGAPVTLKIEAELASRLGDALQFGQALPMLREIIARTQQLYGPDHILVQDRRFELAGTLVQAGQPDEAIPILIDVRQRLLAITGAETNISARVLNQLGMAYYLGRRYAESLQAYQSARDYSVAATGESSVLSLGTGNNIANTLAHMGRTKDAISLAQKLFDTKRRVEGADRPDTLWFERNLAVDYLMDGNLPAAETVFRDVLDRARPVMTHGEHVLGKYESELGELLAKEGKTQEARALLTESLATLTKTLGPADENTLHAQSLLASLPTAQ